MNEVLPMNEVIAVTTLRAFAMTARTFEIPTFRFSVTPFLQKPTVIAPFASTSKKWEKWTGGAYG